MSTFKPTEYYGHVRTSKDGFHNFVIRNEMKSRNDDIVEELENDEKILCIYKMTGETLYESMNRLNKQVTELKKRVEDLEYTESNIDVKHILGECISNYLVKGINDNENENYENWEKIPEDVYRKYNINKGQLRKLKKERDLQCHPKKIDIYKLSFHYLETDDANIITNIIKVFYDLKSNRFKI